MTAQPAAAGSPPLRTAAHRRILDQLGALALGLLSLTVLLRDVTGSAPAAGAARLLLLVALGALAPGHGRRRWPFMVAALALTVWVWAVRPDATAVLNRALDGAAFVAAFFSTMGILRHAAELSPGITRAAQFLAGQPPGRRFIALMAGGQTFSLLLGYGAISLLGAMVISSTRDEPDPAIRSLRRKRMLLAVQSGFVGAIAWSPLSFGVILTLSLVPDSSWPAILPFTLVTSGILSLLAWSIDQALKPPRRGLPPSARDRRARDIAPLLLLLGLLAAGLTALQSVAEMRASVGVMILVPCLSLAWMALSTPDRQSRPARAARELRLYVSRQLPSFGSEITLMSLASFLGTAGGTTLAPIVSRAIDLHAVPAPLLLVALVWIVPLMGYLGAHPLLSLSLIYPLLPAPDALGVHPTALATALTAGWAISGATSPFTAATMMIGRFAGISPLRVGLAWNGPFTAGALVLCSAWIWLLSVWL